MLRYWYATCLCVFLQFTRQKYCMKNVNFLSSHACKDFLAKKGHRHHEYEMGDEGITQRAKVV